MKYHFSKLLSISGYAKESKDIQNLISTYGTSGMIEINRFAVDSRYRKLGLGGDLMAHSFVYEDQSDQRPLVFTKPIDIPFKIYPQWIQNSMKELGKPFFYEGHDTFPCQIYIDDSKSKL